MQSASLRWEVVDRIDDRTWHRFEPRHRRLDTRWAIARHMRRKNAIVENFRSDSQDISRVDPPGQAEPPSRKDGRRDTVARPKVSLDHDVRND